MKPQVNVSSNRVILLIFLCIALYACYWLIKPFLQPIILAILIGWAASPLHKRLVVALRGRATLASLLSCLALTLVLVLPMIVLLIAVLKQGISYSVIVRDWATSENFHHLMSHPWVLELQARVTKVLPAGTLDSDRIRTGALEAASLMGRQFASISTSFLGSLSLFVIHFLLLLFVLFFVLRDHDKLIAFLHRALPLSNSQEDTLFQEVKDVSKSALMGSLLTAITQGAVGGTGLWLAGFPGVFWGAIMALASLIPFVGSALVWLPAALYLMVTGEMKWAIFLLVWGVVVIGSIDNFLRPLFMHGASMNTVVVFFSLLGGLHLFGLVGLIYGPLLFSIALVLYKLYESEFADFLEQQDRS
jgi:predicted PurR-regulated permease PerM